MTTTKSGAILGMAESYNANSKFQSRAIELSTSFIQQAIDIMDIIYSPSSPLIIADFGSAQGLNSIHAMKTIIDYFRKTKKDMREVLVVHNDLPTNDWTSLFQLLIEDNSYRGVASGGSFFEQCLPSNSLSIGYSSTSIHWLSKKPCNISDHCFIGLAGDLKEREAFQSQSRLDYIHFLEHRSRELLPGGVLILVILGRNNDDNYEVIHEFYKCAQSILTPQELLDFTLPCYLRSYEECIDEELFARCSFQLITSDSVSMKSPMFERWQQGQMTLNEFVRSNTLFIRGWSESVLKQALINNNRAKEEIQPILDRCWTLYEEKTKERPDAVGGYRLQYIYLVLKKKSA